MSSYLPPVLEGSAPATWTVRVAAGEVEDASQTSTYLSTRPIDQPTRCIYDPPQTSEESRRHQHFMAPFPSFPPFTKSRMDFFFISSLFKIERLIILIILHNFSQKAFFEVRWFYHNALNMFGGE